MTLGQQPLGSLVMLLDQLAFIERDYASFADHEPATDYGVIHADRLAEDHRRDRVMHGATGVFDAVEIDGEEVGTFAGFERADVRAA